MPRQVCSDQGALSYGDCRGLEADMKPDLHWLRLGLRGFGGWFGRFWLAEAAVRLRAGVGKNLIQPKLTVQS